MPYLDPYTLPVLRDLILPIEDTWHKLRYPKNPPKGLGNEGLATSFHVSHPAIRDEIILCRFERDSVGTPLEERIFL